MGDTLVALLKTVIHAREVMEQVAVAIFEEREKLFDKFFRECFGPKTHSRITRLQSGIGDPNEIGRLMTDIELKTHQDLTKDAPIGIHVQMTGRLPMSIKPTPIAEGKFIYEDGKVKCAAAILVKLDQGPVFPDAYPACVRFLARTNLPGDNKPVEPPKFSGDGSSHRNN